MQVSFFVISQSYVVIGNCQFAVNCKNEIVVNRRGLQLCYTSCACRADSGTVIYHQSFWKHVDDAVMVFGRVANPV